MADVTDERTPPPGEEKTELRRVMGVGLLLLFIVCDILGTGIYALTAGQAGALAVGLRRAAVRGRRRAQTGRSGGGGRVGRGVGRRRAGPGSGG